MKKIISLLAVLTMIFTLTACGQNNSETNNDSISITMSGSNSVEKLAKGLGEAYKEKDSKAVFSVQGGGSSAGVPNTASGSSDIGLLSRNLKDSEKKEGLTEYVVAIDGIAVAVHETNKVTNLTLEDLNKIYTKEVTNWSEFGGDDLEIVVIGREAGSGTRDGFETVVGITDVKQDQEYSETGAIISAVNSTPGAIGYISTSYVNNAKKVLLVNDVEASLTNIQDGTYPLQRNFIMVTKSDNEDAKVFLDFVLSDEGQKVVELVGSIPVK